ncbi:MAG: divergent polysaccharide deacetylase family protein [Candidatus Omnitrophota bacterium]
MKKKQEYKNTLIAFLCVVVLVQSLVLLHVLRPRQAVRRKKKIAVAALHPELKTPVAPVLLPRPAPPAKPQKILGKIALVIDDWGYNLRNQDFITDNDFHVTVSVLPFKAYSTHVAQLAFHKNKDVVIHMPMEPLSKEEYGLEEKTLLTTMDAKTVLRFLDEAMAVVPYAKGMSNHMGSKATQDRHLMKIVFDYLKGHRLFFLDSLVTSRSLARALAKTSGILCFQRDVFIDNESDPAYIRNQLKQLADVARRKGVAVGLGHDRPSTIAVLTEMIPRLQEEGYQFINLSEIDS